MKLHIEQPATDSQGVMCAGAVDSEENAHLMHLPRPWLATLLRMPGPAGAGQLMTQGRESQDQCYA